jgi:hypothetical protein
MLTVKKSGTTLIELILVLSLIMVLSTAIVVFTRPKDNLDKAHDEKKLSNLSKFEAEVLSGKIDTNVYPDITPPVDITYIHTEDTYEIDTVLEYYTEKSENDGGNNPNVYETGNDLTLL